MLEIFTVYDCKAEVYNRPLFARSTQEAIRMFTDAANNKDGEVGRHPEDYTLFRIGRYSEEKGLIELEKTHISLCKGIDVVKTGGKKLCVQ